MINSGAQDVSSMTGLYRHINCYEFSMLVKYKTNSSCTEVASSMPMTNILLRTYVQRLTTKSQHQSQFYILKEYYHCNQISLLFASIRLFTHKLSNCIHQIQP